MRFGQHHRTMIKWSIGAILCGYAFFFQSVAFSQTREIEPPKVIYLEPLFLRDELSAEEKQLTVEVIIQADGTATLDDATLDQAWVEVVEKALSNSRFEAAKKDGESISSRATVQFSISQPTAAPAVTEREVVRQQSESPLKEKREEGAEEEFAYGATAHIEKPRLDLRRLETQELRALPGAFGDPFRALETLPGVTPYTNALPYVYVRGAPPAGTLFVYDDIALPSLFHLALGPAVIHPAMIGPIVFYSAVGPARFGRRTGGLFTSAQRQIEAGQREVKGELELRLVDLMGMIHTPLGEGSLTVAGRYGYPGLILSLVSPEIDLAYWDYQVRLDQPLEHGIRTEVVWFGAYDSLSVVRDTEGVLLTFHRLELRLLRELRQWEYGTALLLGYEESNSDSGTYEDSEAGSIWSTRIGPRLWIGWNDDNHTRLRLGADMIGIVGKIEREEAAPEISIGELAPKVIPLVPSFVTATDSLNYDQFNNPLYTSVASRNLLGVYSEFGFRPIQSWDVDLGLRGDVWLTGHRSELGVDPRLLLTYYPLGFLDMHAAVGLAHQPAVFLLPLPGIADVALDQGLQEAIQSEAGIGFDLYSELRVEAQAFVHYYTNLLFPELAIEKLNACGEKSSAFYREVADLNICDSGQGFPRATALAYGGELFLHRSLNRSVSGWLSYTLSWAEAQSENGFRFTPVFDRRHVGNMVVQYRPAIGWLLGLRLHVRSGRIFTVLTNDLQRLERRLPGFFRADLQASYGWRTSWGRLQASAEWFNITLAREARSINCGLDITDNNRLAPIETCKVEYGPALFFPNVGLRAEF